MRLAFILVLAAGFVGSQALAHEDHPLSPASQMLIDRFKLADTNHDGSVSRAEWEAHMKARFAAIDKSHDGKLDAAEIAALIASMGSAADMTVADYLKQADKDGDGAVSEAEYVGRGMGRFDDWDTDKNATLTKAEQDAEISRMEAH